MVLAMSDGSDLASQSPPLPDLMRAVLNEEGADQKPVLLSALGQKLSTKSGQPLRDVLSGQVLSKEVARIFGEDVEWSGEGSRLAVKFRGEGISRKSRFNASFWAAFSKPVEAGLLRYIHARYPFQFQNLVEGETHPEDYLHIPSDLIPAADLPKSERDALIKQSIERWTQQNNIVISEVMLREKAPEPVKRDIQQPSVKASGIEAVIRIIELVPEEKRKEYNFSFDLLLTLLRN